jgi:hypothetical protein
MRRVSYTVNGGALRTCRSQDNDANCVMKVIDFPESTVRMRCRMLAAGPVAGHHWSLVGEESCGRDPERCANGVFC